MGCPLTTKRQSPSPSRQFRASGNGEGRAGMTKEMGKWSGEENATFPGPLIQNLDYTIKHDKALIPNRIKM